ncbi:MAG TPA: class II fructose-bisphosphate aldolase [Patescibacteria group bacterium]|nr:class II fructose-bisphosphate aldolase [Patescibacteria group bacterium]
MLTHIEKLVKKADNKNFALGAFNTHNLEFTKAIIRAGEREKSSLIIQVSETSLNYMGVQNIFNLVKNISQDKDSLVALHLDHGKDFSNIKKCIKAGFSSVMIDGSNLSFKENVNITKKVVDYAHEKGVWVQGELGRVIKSSEIEEFKKNPQSFYTKPDKAKEFVKKTNLDTLAVSIGNIHGVYKLKNKPPEISIKRLKEIKNKINIPFVLHGASKLPEDSILAAIQNGVRIINIDTELRQAFKNGLDEVLADKNEFDPRKILGRAGQNVFGVVRSKINLFHSNKN